jgi:NADH-quinone oxidoreductase subunit M
VILGALYMLSLTQKTFFGPLTNPRNKNLPDLSVRETIALAPLVLFVFVIGLFPSIFLDRTKDSVLAFIDHYAEVYRQGRVDEPAARLLPPDPDAAMERGAPTPEGTH